MSSQSENPLPPRPQPPVDYDCCGGGCADCELRLYAQRLAQWQQLEAALNDRDAAA
jgi:hypothetical protein